MTLKNIEKYTGYLNNHHNLRISFHFDAKTAVIINKSDVKNLLTFSNHTNPYCMYIKNVKMQMHKCIQCQKLIIAKCASVDSFIGTCHAGVKEYIHAIMESDRPIGFISVSGYRGIRRGSVVCGEYYKNLLDEEPPETLLNILIPPLSLMLESLCIHLMQTQNVLNAPYEYILNFVRERHNNVSLDDVAKEFNYSKSHISHIFKRHSGYSLNAYCNKLKIEDAKTMLRSTEYSVMEIAHAVGFNDLSYFIHVFKKLTNKTPLQWRKSAHSP